jgi:hypothetical protein
MHDVPHWVGLGGLVLSLLFCGAFLAQVPLLAIIFVLLCIALVVVEIRAGAHGDEERTLRSLSSLA